MACLWVRRPNDPCDPPGSLAEILAQTQTRYDGPHRPLREIDGAFPPMPLPVGDRTYAELHSAGLQHGAQYVIQVHAANQAGMTSSFFSRPITVDTTPPVCVAPKVLPASNRSTDVVAYSCAQGGDCGRGYYGTFMWVGPLISGLTVAAQGGMCSDPESGISAVEIGVARRSRLAPGEPAVAALRSVVPPTEDVIAFDAPLEAGMNHYLVARCVNGAGVTSSFCDAPMFVVDGSPPECAYYLAKTFGEGHMSTVHRNAGQLTIGFEQALWDEHTGLQGMRYALEVAGALSSVFGNQTRSRAMRRRQGSSRHCLGQRTTSMVMLRRT